MHLGKKIYSLLFGGHEYVNEVQHPRNCFHLLKKKERSLCFFVLDDLQFLGKRVYLGYLSQPPVVDRSTEELIRQQLNFALFVCQCSCPKDLSSSANTHFWSLKAGVSVPRLALKPLSSASLAPCVAPTTLCSPFLLVSVCTILSLLPKGQTACHSGWCHCKRTKACVSLFNFQ